MSKKTTYITISVILSLLIVGIIGYYLYLKNVNSDNPTTSPNIFSGFFPFGGDDNNNTDQNTDNTPTEETPTENSNDYVKKLRKITSEPVAGAGILSIKAGDVVRYIEKATGHIYEVELFSPRQGRISNTTIPQVYDSLFGNGNNSLIARYLKDDDRTIETYSLNIKQTSTTTENTISGILISNKVTDVSVFGNSIFYTEKLDTSSVGYIANFAITSKKQIWNSPIKDILSQYPNAKTVTITTKPDENSLGYLYFIDTGTGSFRKVLNDIYGLSTYTSPDASRVMYLNQGGGGVGLYVFDVKNEQTQNITPATFPEKCTWSKTDINIVYCAVPSDSLSSGSLNLWYKGLVQYEDTIWKYNLKDNTSNILFGFNSETSEIIDVIKPVLSEDENYILFINKRDDSLWSLDLTK